MYSMIVLERKQVISLININTKNTICHLTESSDIYSAFSPMIRNDCKMQFIAAIVQFVSKIFADRFTTNAYED